MTSLRVILKWNDYRFYIWYLSSWISYIITIYMKVGIEISKEFSNLKYKITLLLFFNHVDYLQYVDFGNNPEGFGEFFFFLGYFRGIGHFTDFIVEIFR